MENKHSDIGWVVVYNEPSRLAETWYEKNHWWDPVAHDGDQSGETEQSLAALVSSRSVSIA